MAAFLFSLNPKLGPWVEKFDCLAKQTSLGEKVVDSVSAGA